MWFREVLLSLKCVEKIMCRDHSNERTTFFTWYYLFLSTLIKLNLEILLNFIFGQLWQPEGEINSLQRYFKIMR